MTTIHTYIHLLSEAWMEPLPYGYWITPEGETISVRGRLDHAKFTPNGTFSAVENGWIRIVIRDYNTGTIEMNCEISADGPLTTASVQSLENLCNTLEYDHGKTIDVFYLDVSRGPSKTFVGDIRRQVSSWFRSELRKRLET